jgi:parallel beta-helix repeat protein
MTKFTLPFVLSICCALQAFGANYYFSSSGGDDNRTATQARNSATPWKTLKKLEDIFSSLQPGDSVLFRRGESFFGNIRITKSGSPGAPIVLGAYGRGERPIITGFLTVTSWAPTSTPGVFESPVLATAEAVNMVTINGRPYAMGRFPNATAANKGYLNFESSSGNSITDNQLPGSPNWGGGEVVIRTTRWTMERLPIISHSRRVVTFGGQLQNALSNGYGFFIQNHLRTLDQYGEWFYNKSTKKLVVFFGSQGPGNAVVQVAAINLLVEPRANDIVLDNLTLTGANQYAVFNDWGGMRNLTIKNSQILFTGMDAIHLSNRTRFVLENCLINHTNGRAVNLNHNNPYATVRNNTIRNSGQFPGMMAHTQSYGIVSYTKGLTAEYNKIYNTGYAGIRFAGDSNLIKNNVIDTFCTVLDDGSGIYSWTGSANTTNTRRSIIGNIVMNGIGAAHGTNNLSYAAAEGIYLDDNVNNVEVRGNTVAHCTNNGLFVHNARNIQIVDNVFFNNGVQFQTAHDHLGNPITNLTVANNRFIAKQAKQTVTTMRSQKNDLNSVGTFSGNYYARPLDDNMTIYTEFQQDPSNRVNRWLDFPTWQSMYGRNQDAGSSPIKVNPYTVTSANDASNRFPIGNFENSAAGIYCWSPTGDCYTTWVTTSTLDKRAVKVTGSNSGNFSMPCSAVDKTKQYILRFSAVGEIESTVEVYLMQLNSPWNTISEIKSLKINTKRTEYEVLINNPSTEATPCIVLKSSNGRFSYWVDNVGLYEAVTAPTNPDHHIMFEYNASNADRVISLAAGVNFLDINKVARSGSIVLKPFSSTVLFKQSPTGTTSSNINNFRTQVDKCRVRLNWFWNVDELLSHFEVEKSTDGANFTLLTKIEGKSIPGLYPFQFLDSLAQTKNYYRLKMVDKDGNYRYSEVLEEQTDCGSTEPWQIFPTLVPAGNGELSIKLFTRKPVVIFTIIDQIGRVIQTMKTEATLGWNTFNWALPNLQAGLYYVYHSDLVNKKAIPFFVGKN